MMKEKIQRKNLYSSLLKINSKYNKKNTKSFTFSQQMKEYWTYFYHIAGKSGINALRGVGGKNKKGFDNTGFNFRIPSIQ